MMQPSSPALSPPQTEWIFSRDFDETLKLVKRVQIENGEEYHYEYNLDLVLFDWICQATLGVSEFYIGTARTCEEVSGLGVYVEDKFFAERALHLVVPEMQQKFGINVKGVITPYSAHSSAQTPHIHLVFDAEKEIIEVQKKLSRNQRNEQVVKFSTKWKEVEKKYQDPNVDVRSKKTQTSSLATKFKDKKILHLDDRKSITDELEQSKTQPPFDRVFPVHFDKDDSKKKWLDQMADLVGLKKVCAEFLEKIKKNQLSKNLGLAELGKLIFLQMTCSPEDKKYLLNLEKYFLKDIAKHIPPGIKDILLQREILSKKFFEISLLDSVMSWWSSPSHSSQPQSSTQSPPQSMQQQPSQAQLSESERLAKNLEEFFNGW